MSVHSEARKITTHTLQGMKQAGEKITMLTAYDYSLAKLVDQAGVDVILVGDSASNVMAGHETTLPITLDQIIYHASSVVRGVKRALVVVDLPFGSYQSNSGEALRSAIRIMKESGAHAIKMEGGSEIKESIIKILNAGIPVMGHLGLTPQSIYKFGTYTVRAKEEKEAEKLLLQQQQLGILLDALQLYWKRYLANWPRRLVNLFPSQPLVLALDLIVMDKYSSSTTYWESPWISHHDSYVVI